MGPVQHLPEWEPASFLLVALDDLTLLSLQEPFLSDTPENPAAAAIVEIAATVGQFVPVVILVDGNPFSEDPLKVAVRQLMQESPSLERLIRQGQVRFVQIPTNSVWLRDYGPEFVRDARGKLVLIDNIYRINPEKSVKQEEIENFEDFLERRLEDDQSPGLLALRLREVAEGGGPGAPVPISRSPISVDGGDFMTNGAGVAFTSTATLWKNGGNLELLRKRFRDYLGAEEVVFLEPLPGNVIKHLDMFFQIANPKVYLLATFSGMTEDPIVHPLQAEAQRILDYNQRILQAFFEQKGRNVKIITEVSDTIAEDSINILRIPIPPPERPFRAEISQLQDELRQLKQTYYEMRVQAERARDEFEAVDERLMNWAARAQATESWASTPDSLDSSQLLLVLNKIIYFPNHSQTSRLSLPDGFDFDPFVSRAQRVKAFVHEHLELIDSSQIPSEIHEEFHEHLKATRDVAATYAQILEVNFDMRLSAAKAANERLSKVKRRHDDVAHQVEVAEYEGELSIMSLSDRGNDIYKTYLNLLPINTESHFLLLTPVFEEAERESLALIKKAYDYGHGDVQILPLQAEHLSRLQGSAHCIARTLPSGVQILHNDWAFLQDDAMIKKQTQ